MGDDDRVVLRSTWLVDALTFLPLPLALGLVLFWGEGVRIWLSLAAPYVVATVFHHRTTRVVLTADGVELWRNGRTAVPWSYVGGVVVVDLAYSLRSVGVLLPHRSVRPLPAPRSLLGVGGRDVANARELIERHSVRHRAELTSAPPTA
jgi:hypothetical protein